MFIESPRFPTDLSFQRPGGSMFNNDVQVLESGHEQRNEFWPYSRRQFEVGYGIRELTRVQDVNHIFRAVRGMSAGFRIRDWRDYKSVPITSAGLDGETQDPITAFDQIISVDTTSTDTFQLIYTARWGCGYERKPITKPVLDSVLIAVNGTPLTSNDFTLDSVSAKQAAEGHETVGIVTLDPYFARSLTPTATLTISGIRNQLFATVTTSAPHGLAAGDMGTFASVGGMTEINTLSASVLQVVDTTHFRIDINTLDMSTYTSGGTFAVLERVTAGYVYDLPVRFNTDHIPMSFEAWEAAGVDLPVVELRV